MPRKAALKMKAMLDKIVTDPEGFRGDWKPLAGTDYWRLRMGGYRAICTFEGGELTLLVLKIGSRGDIYK